MAKKKKIYDYEKENEIKVKKGKIRYDRIFMILFIIIIIIFSVISLKKYLYNKKVYNNISKSSKVVMIKLNKNKIDFNTSNIKYINKNIKKINVKTNHGIINIDGNKIKKGLNFDIKMYNKKLKSANFNSSKSLFIDSNEIINKSNKIIIKLPKYLYKNEIVDIYGVTKDNDIEIIEKCYKIKDKKVKIKLSNNYKKYFVTYVKVTDFKVDNKIETVKNEYVKLNIKYLPSTATKKEIEYTNIGDAFVVREKNLIARKSGEYKITLKNNESDIKKVVNINVKKNNNVIEKINGLTYINGIIVVNKSYPVDKDYNPESLTKETKSAFENMKNDAKKDGINLYISSGFRSYETQEELYNYYVKNNGQKKADTFSARAGYSEHQTGLAMDLNIVDSSFEGTPEAIWLENNSYKYGFIIRYPKGKENITGYKYEPWHVRYLGKELATKIYNSNLTLEEYLDIESKYSE